MEFFIFAENVPLREAHFAL